MNKEWKKEFDARDVKTINHHHYIRKRGVKSFITTLLKEQRKEILDEIDYIHKYPGVDKYENGWNNCLNEVNNIVNKQN